MSIIWLDYGLFTTLYKEKAPLAERRREVWPLIQDVEDEEDYFGCPKEPETDVQDWFQALLTHVSPSYVSRWNKFISYWYEYDDLSIARGWTRSVS